MNGRLYECEGCERQGAVDRFATTYECPRCRWVGHLSSTERQHLRSVMASLPWVQELRREHRKVLHEQRLAEGELRRQAAREDERRRLLANRARTDEFLTALHKKAMSMPPEWWRTPTSLDDVLA